MAISSRADLIEYCLRRLGKPVIEINVSEQQVEDRIDDALQFWGEFFFDGVERMYLKKEIVASELRFATGDTANFIKGENIVGSSSAASAKVYDTPDTLRLSLAKTVGEFISGETITGDQSNATAVLATNPLTLGNWDLKYLELPDSVVGVTRLLTLGPGTAGTSPRNIFDVVYQFRQTDLYDLMSTDLIYYAQVKMHLQMLDHLFPGERSLRFNRKAGRLFIDINWGEVLIPGNYIVAEVFRVLNPADTPKIYNDLWLKRYATALIKRQWAENIGKYANVKLPGGVTLNGEMLWNQAAKEIEDTEKEILDRQEPPFFMVG
jgi:hypothetical protein